MKQLNFLIVALAMVIWMSPAMAIVGEATVKVADGAAPIAQATITITFKNQAGKPIQTVRRPTVSSGPKTGTRSVKIPDDTRTADITVTAANGKTQTRVDLDVALLKDREIVIDVPGGASPPNVGAPWPRTASPVEPVYPAGGGLPIAGGASWTRIPQVSGGTRLVGGAETSIVDSRRSIPGVSAAMGFVVPTDRVFFNFDYFSIAAGVNGFDDRVSGAVPVGASSAFTYIFPNPASGSTGIGPTATGQSVTIATKGQFWDLVLGANSRVPAGPIFARPTGSFWNYGLGVRYRFMNVEHDIAQQSATFPDLNLAIALDLHSHFIGPNFTFGFEAMQPLPSGMFGGASAFVSPGVLITDASARQASRCGPCGAASPEFDLVLQRNFTDTSFAIMTGVSGFVGYRFNPNVRVQGEASYQYLSQLKSFAVPTSPARQPIGLASQSSDIFSVGGRLVFEFNPAQPMQQTAR